MLASCKLLAILHSATLQRSPLARIDTPLFIDAMFPEFAVVPTLSAKSGITLYGGKQADKLLFKVLAALDVQDPSTG